MGVAGDWLSPLSLYSKERRYSCVCVKWCCSHDVSLFRQSWADEPLSWEYLCNHAREGRVPMACPGYEGRVASIKLFPVGHGGWSLLLGHLWSDAEIKQYQGVVIYMSHVETFATRVFKALFESWSRDQGTKGPRWPLNYKSRVCGWNLTFDSLKIKQSRASEGSNQAIKYALHWSNLDHSCQHFDERHISDYPLNMTDTIQLLRLKEGT